MNTFRSLSESRSFISLWLLFLALSTFIPVCDAESSSESPSTDQHLNHSFHEHPGALIFSHSERADKYCCDVLSAQTSELSAILPFTAMPDVWIALTDFVSPAVIPPALFHLPDDGHKARFRSPRLPVYRLTRRVRI
ncbi:MAG TPA: hypothetical protein ENJ08_17100 [Gammaproteobacteria bacterium]|nr:hypothetical protein [Gammaproteobacteria bacterium]